MIVGIDCYHDISAGKRSIGALVASLNQGMSRLVSKTETWGRVHTVPWFALCKGLLYSSFPFCDCAIVRLISSVIFIISLSRWFSRCVLQHKGQEIMDGLKMVLSGKLLSLILQISYSIFINVNSINNVSVTKYKVMPILYLFSSCTERISEVQQLPAHAYHCVPRRSGRWSAAQCGQLWGRTDHGLHQVHRTQLRVSFHLYKLF